MPAPGSQSTDTDKGAVAEAHAYYARQLELGVERFLGQPLTACPWCGAGDFERRTVCRDLRQGKPGSFPLDTCRACGHVFQNPPVDDEGLSFYYRDTYDGLNAEEAEERLGALGKIYRRRAETVARHRTDVPRNWLDIGTASAHFCETAAEVFPGTTFDGLDMSDGVLSGHSRGRIATAYQGQLLDLRAELAGRYDQVSMFHYLEHTRDPLAELDAAVEVMTDDGWLLIEQPDPQSRSSRLFGSWWAGWNQPEHLNMVTLDNLVAALRNRGLEVVDVVRRDAHIPLESLIVVMTLLRMIAPEEVPWEPRRRLRFSRARKLLGWIVVAPLIPVAMFLDAVVLPRLLHSYHAYRVLARKPSNRRGGDMP